MLASLLLVLAALLGVNLVARAVRSRRRARAAVLPPGEAALRRVEQVPARIFIDGRVAGGPKPGGYSQGLGTLVLTARRVVLASEWGRVLEVREDLPGELRWAGPRRIVVEGSHPSGRARVRAELILDKEGAFLDEVADVPGATVHRRPE